MHYYCYILGWNFFWEFVTVTNKYWKFAKYLKVILFISDNAQRTIFCRIQVRKNIGLNTRFWSLYFGAHVPILFYRRQNIGPSLRLFCRSIIKYFDAHDPTFCRSYCAVTKAGEAPLLDCPIFIGLELAHMVPFLLQTIGQIRGPVLLDQKLAHTTRFFRLR